QLLGPAPHHAAGRLGRAAGPGGRSRRRRPSRAADLRGPRRLLAAVAAADPGSPAHRGPPVAAALTPAVGLVRPHGPGPARLRPGRRDVVRGPDRRPGRRAAGAPGPGGGAAAD